MNAAITWRELVGSNEPRTIMQDDARRFEARRVLEAAGAMVASYEGGSMTLKVKRGCFAALCEAAKVAGGDVVGNGCFYFPLGSDNPPEEWRHWTLQYPKEKGWAPGFWLYVRVSFPALAQEVQS